MAASTALRNLNDKEPRQPRAPTTKSADGTRSWTVEASDKSSNEDDWKARLRSIIDP